MMAFMRRIRALRHRNPEKYRLNTGRSATNPDTQTGTRGAEWFNECHHRSRLPADLRPVSPIITVVTVNAFSPRARVFL